MRFDIIAPSDVRQGDPVPVTLRLTNTSDRPLTVYLQGRPTAFDIVVKDEAGTVVWRRLEGQTITAILGIRTLEPGAALSFEDAWPQRDRSGRPTPPGLYTITGALPTDAPEPLVTRATTTRVGPGP